MRLFAFFISFLLLSFGGLSQKPDFRFKRINVNNGLSHSNVASIVQDQRGYMWFATYDGLNRYDGYNIKVYSHSSLDSTSILSNDVNVLQMDDKGNLWIGTRSGLNLYNREKDSFISFPELGNGRITSLFIDRKGKIFVGLGADMFKYNENTNTFQLFKRFSSPKGISWMYEDSRGNFWVSTFEQLYLYEKAKKDFRPFTSVKYQNIITICEDKDGNVWFGSIEEGLMMLNHLDNTITYYRHDPSNPNSISKNNVQALLVDANNNLWIGTQNGGITLYDIKQRKFYRYENDPGNSESLSFNSINCFYIDQNNDMWLGTFSGGVNFVRETLFPHRFKNILDHKSLSNNAVSSFCRDRKGNIWIGTDGGGVNIYNKEKDTFRHLRHDPKDPNSISADVITTIISDHEGNLWIGYWAGGMDIFTPEGRKIKHIKYTEIYEDKDWLKDCVMYLYEDVSHNIWVGLLNGLYLYDKEKNEFKSYYIEEGGNKNYVFSMYDDSQGNLWKGTWDGLYLMDRSTGKTREFVYSKKVPNTISSNIVYVVTEDSKNRLWVGTAGGLNLYDRKTNSFTIFDKSKGLPSDAVYGILEDQKGNLWISTSNGLSKFNYEEKTFKNYNISDGLQGNEFKYHSFLKLPSGEMLFGGTNGFNIFNPANIKENKYIPPIEITDFKIFNTSPPIGAKNSPLKKHISLTEEITLSYKESVLSFDFAALNYISPEKNQYAFMMEGFDKSWNYVGTQRTTTYTNLDPGKYVFKVKGSNNDGVWNEKGRTLMITITPPYWKTDWFIFLLVLLISGGTLGFYTYRIRSIEKQKKMLEKQVEERTSEILQQKEELSFKTETLEKANEEIKSLYNELSDSIRSAQAIQNSILPSESYIQQYLPDSFILFKPKDVVSGDFYWFEVLNNKVIIAAADCTGHGVSGALITIACHHLLNKVVGEDENITPSDILNRLNKDLKNERHNQMYDDSEMGMDIALCVLNMEKKTLQYSGARNPLYIIRNGELIQFKATAFSIGMHLDFPIEYKSNEIQLVKGDSIFIFTDGFVDQIGGETGKDKFLYHNFRQLLLSIREKSMQEQLVELKNNLAEWQGPTEQLDDILVIGFRI